MFTEPQTSIAPRLKELNIGLKKEELKSSVSLLCLAQAYPMPYFRLGPPMLLV